MIRAIFYAVLVAGLVWLLLGAEKTGPASTIRAQYVEGL